MVEPKVTTNQKEQLYILSVNRHTYEVAKEYVDNCINMAREVIKPIEMAIIAIEKEYKVIMLKETYFDTRKYYKAIDKYVAKGFTVHTVKEVE